MKKQSEPFEFIVPVPDSVGVNKLACNLKVSGIAYRGALEEGGVFVDYDLNEILHTDKQGRESDILDFINSEKKFGHLDELYLNEVIVRHIEKNCFGAQEPEHTDHNQDDLFERMGQAFNPMAAINSLTTKRA